ncbi:hypothetical protein [Micromonospora parathelypteridis]|uniref:Uncharacterized protein n=1 Tax=Micromonospora parathelypteridis TaxID=1839617 RepID=A0A840VLW8_9ACTN|nr:hypothetical protein [Micromonospora parathelypteridis]MBB5477655.1 hypothetical protein [Micromonospora parathelypteridis]GGO10953.1 hypothetical protein GCM10011576_18940 [Micromonospora parathelypteridis]
MAAVSRTNKPSKVTSHPDWCDPERCGYLVPPVMAHMARRHRGPMQRVGDGRAAGLVVTYLIGAEALDGALVGVHVTCRSGIAWAELSLLQAIELAEQLGALVKQVLGEPKADDE